MTDFTQLLTDSLSEEKSKETPGAALVNRVKARKQAEEEKRIDGKFRAAYEQSGLDSLGTVSPNTYDFKEAYKGGVTFKPADGESGIKLPNKFVKPNTVEIAGYDFKTGQRLRNKYEEDEYLLSGLESLRASAVDTKLGVPWDDIDGLNRVAFGLVRQGATFDDYMAELDKTPWSGRVEQALVAWNSAESVHKATVDAETLSADNEWVKSAMDPEVPHEKLMELESKYEGLTEEDLPTNPDWLDSARKIYAYNTGEDPSAISDEELHQYLIDTMGLFNNNLPEMMLMAREAKTSGDPEYAQAFLNAMAIYEATDMDNWNELARVLKGQASDLTNYITFGGGILATKLGGAAIKTGIKKELLKITSGLAADVATGAAFGAGFEKAKQDVEIGAGERQDNDLGEIGSAAAISGAVTGAIGTPLNVISDEALRKYAGEKLKRGWSNLMNYNGPKVGPSAQRGNINPGAFVPEAKPQAEAYYPLLKHAEKVIDLDAPATEKNVMKFIRKIRQEVDKGNISIEAGDWMPLEEVFGMFNDSAKASGMTFTEYMAKDVKIRDFVEMAHDYMPKVTVKEVIPRYGHMKIGLGNEYSETVIALDRTTYGDQGVLHYKSEKDIDPEEVVAGHFRSEGKGNRLVILEEQMDSNKNIKALGGLSKPSTVAAKRAKERETERAAASELKRLKAEQNKGKNTSPSLLAAKFIEAANEFGVDPFEKNAVAEVIAKARSKAKFGEPDLYRELLDIDGSYGVAQSFTPYQKTWQMLMGRMQVKKAIEEGKDEILWPANPRMLQVIEQWSDEAYDLYGPALSRVYTKDKVKAMEKLGFKVEKVEIPEYSGPFRDKAGLMMRDGKITNRDVLSELRPEFFRVKITKELREKFMKEGVPLMSVGGAAMVGGNDDDQSQTIH